MSPRCDYIAILTNHTVHIAIIPERSHLTAPDSSPMRMKTYTLGPTTHVTTQSAIASALWHPLGVSGLCLVTVTRDAIVRVWELSVADRWSFDKPTISIDLQKLVDGTSQEQDFSASTTGMMKSVSYSPDSYEMEVASAAFSSRGGGGWSPMTLWIAMKQGDVYALCPLLPEKWSPPSTLIPSLSVAIVANVAAIEDDHEVSQQKKQLAQQQLAWMSDIDIQEPQYVEGFDGGPDEEVYTRPSKPGKVPKLQGPFDFELAPAESDDELDGMLSDIYVIGPKVDAEQLMFGEDDELDIDEADQGLSIGIVCLLTRSGRLSVCLDIDMVEAQWLPKTKSKVVHYDDEDEDYPSLLTFQVMDTMFSGELWEGNWPMFSHDLDSRYSFYVTNTSNVVYISLTPWVFRLETELEEGAAGTDFRIDLLAKGHSSIREPIHRQKLDDHSDPLAASVLMRDPDLGTFLLTANYRGPQVVVFEAPADDFEIAERSPSPSYDSEPNKPVLLHEPRPVYEPAHQLDVRSSLPMFLEKLRNSKFRRILKEDVKLSPATLTIMTDAHKILSEETHHLGAAAAELFRRVEILQEGLRSQINKANEVAARVEAISGEDIKEGPVITSNAAIEERIKAAKERQEVLAERLEKVRRKVSKGTSRELSDKEIAWMEEVTTMQYNVLGEGDLNESVSRRTKQPWERYQEVQDLKEDLTEQIQNLDKQIAASPQGGVKVPPEIRKMKTAQIMKLLDRETALVEGAKSRLERLTLAE